jgi:hypothetical protein
MFLEGGVYVTPPFDLDNQDYLRPTLYYFLFIVKLLNDILKLLRCRLYECYMYLNLMDMNY